MFSYVLSLLFIVVCKVKEMTLCPTCFITHIVNIHVLNKCFVCTWYDYGDTILKDLICQHGIYLYSTIKVTHANTDNELPAFRIEMNK